MDDKEKIKRINELLKLLIDLPPLISYDDPGALNAEMRYGLAQAYAIKGFRDWLIRNFRASILQTAIGSEDNISQTIGKIHAMTFKKILSDGETAFHELDKLNKSLKK